MQVEVGAELQPAVGVRDGEAALDVVGDRLAGGVRQIVERQDDDVVADADAAGLAAVALAAQLVLADHDPILPAYQRLVARKPVVEGHSVSVQVDPSRRINIITTNKQKSILTNNTD